MNSQFFQHILVCQIQYSLAWWRHQKETFSALLAICAGNSPVTGEFPTPSSVTRSFDVFFDLRLNKRLSKQWWGWWFETPSRPTWRHRNEFVMLFFFCGYHRWVKNIIHWCETKPDPVYCIYQMSYFAICRYINFSPPGQNGLHFADPVHDGVIKWKHFPRYRSFVRGIHRSPVNSHRKGQCDGVRVRVRKLYLQSVHWKTNNISTKKFASPRLSINR